MPPRVVSPFRPARPAVIEPIDQPLYDSLLLAATIAAQNLFFQTSFGAAGSNKVFTNLDIPGMLANPKIFVILGMRLHFAQNVGTNFQAAHGGLAQDIAIAVEGTFYNLFIGNKDYFTCPGFYLSSGLGLVLMPAGAGAEAADEFVFTATLGAPLHHQHKQINRHPITIPPQQSFNASLNVGAGLAPVMSGTRRVWHFLEGDLGREVQ